MSNKTAQLERDLELERRKVRDFQDASRERDKEYQKLKIQHDKLRRKALLGPTNVETSMASQSRTPENYQHRIRHNGGPNGSPTNIEAFVGGMEVSGIQRTPLVPRIQHPFTTTHQGSGWTKPLTKQTGTVSGGQHRQPFAAAPMTQVPAVERSYRSVTGSERSDSGNEVEQMLLGTSRMSMNAGWGPAAVRSRPAFAPPAPKRSSRGFRPAIPNP